MGEFTLLIGHTPINLGGSARAQALVAYLALHHETAQTRPHLAYRFWPDATEAQARNNLRQTLFQLRRAWPEAERYLLADAHSVGWQSDLALEVDVAAFERALAAADGAARRNDPAAELAALREAAQLYRGDLLPGCYDEWLEADRERLRQAYRAALARLARMLEGARAYHEAIGHAAELLRLDGLDEDACASLMRLHALNNDRAAALRLFREMEARLERELGVAPGPALREAHERLLRPAAAEAPWLTAWPMVGRQAEWTRLQAAWRRAAGGRAELALVSGEAGIGKTRLAEELLIWAGRQGIATARTRAYAAEGRLAYGPVADWLRSPVMRESLGRLPGPLGTEAARLLPELLVERPDIAAPEPLTEHWQRQRFFETLARVVLGAGQPLLLLFDDLQWCDPETLEWLHYLLRFDPGARLLLLGTARAEDIVPPHPLNPLLTDMQAAGCATLLPLDPLNFEATAQLARHAADGALEPEAAAAVFHETEGNPLFVVETIRARQGRAPSGGTASPRPGLRPPLPPRVHGVIASRLRQLTPAAGELAGLAATIGRAFRLDVLAGAAGMPETDLARGLDELWQRRIVREQGASLYDFSHDKLREVAYAEVSPPLRRLLHRRVAQALETTHAADLPAVSGQIAAHYEQAGLPAPAIPHYQRAATAAQRVFANEEAIDLLHKALALLASQPETPERQSTELALQTSLGAALVASRGYDVAEVLEAYGRALALCHALGQTPSAPILRGLAIASIGRGNILQAHQFGEQLHDLAETTHDSLLTVEADYVLGVTWFWQGDFNTSRGLLERALARYQPQQLHAHLALYSQDPEVICRIRLAFTLWCLGYPAQALAARHAALERAEAVAHPLSLSYARVWSAMLHYTRRDQAAVRAEAEAILAMDRTMRVSYWVPFARVLRGWARHQQGERQAGWSEIEAGLETLQTVERSLFKPYFLGLRAELHGQDGEAEQGLACLQDALNVMERKAERWCEAELRRVEGELLLRAGQPAAAAKSLRRSLAIAQAQRARSLELRAAAALARRWPDTGRPALAAALAWFADEPDFPELSAARSLLARP